jgi:hypothetical protein
VFLLVFLATGSCLAKKDLVDAEKKVRKEMGILTRKLSLTPVQTSKIELILLNAQKMLEVSSKRANESGEVLDKKKIRQDKKRLKSENDHKIIALLSSEQGVVYKQYKLEQAEKSKDSAKKKKQKGVQSVVYGLI